MKALFRPITRFFALAFLDHCATRVAVDLATTREHLAMAEADYNDMSRTSMDVMNEVLELRRREEALLEEASYIDFKRASLREERA